MNLKNWYAGGGKIPICLAVLLLLCTNMPAQETQVQTLRLSPEEAVERAIKNNLSLESSRVNLVTKKRASSMSWNQFIPGISVSGTLARDNEVNTASDMSNILNPLFEGIEKSMGMPGMLPRITAVDPIQWHILATIQTSLTLSAAMFEGMKLLRLDYESGVLSYDKAKAQTERDVRKLYHNMLLMQERISLLRSSFENVERQVQMAQANYNAGLAPELTLLQARVARENMRPAIDQAENGMKLLMAQFAMYLGLGYNTNFELIPITENIAFIPFDVAQMISKAAANKPDIQELRHTIQLLKSQKKATQLQTFTPYLNLNWSLNPVFTRDPWKDSWGESDFWMDRGTFSITLGIRLHSLIPFSPDFQGIKKIDDQIRTANIGLAQMINGTEIEIYNTVLSLESTRINAEAQAENISLAEQSYRLTEEAYRAGLVDYFQVQNAEQSLQQARVQLLEQQFNYINGLIDLEYSTGVPFGTLSGRSE